MARPEKRYNSPVAVTLAVTVSEIRCQHIESEQRRCDELRDDYCRLKDALFPFPTRSQPRFLSWTVLVTNFLNVAPSNLDDKNALSPWRMRYTDA
ncbi:hypothetical protein BGY98DRAFT_976083 [Russula aff. rugulosa BPL654]|nr:hypothetical protein BGY98DRAFT_976083 [Russula aff. rugulosa BPL654]